MLRETGKARQQRRGQHRERVEHRRDERQQERRGRAGGQRPGPKTQRSGHLGPQFADDENTSPVDATGRVGGLPAYQILDMVLRYTHAPTGLGASLAVKNALDEIYVVSRRPDGIFPAGFRQIIGSVRWTYDEGAR